MSSIPESESACTWVLWYDEFPSDSLSQDQFLERCLRFNEVSTVDEFRKAWRTLVNGSKSIRDNANLRLFRQAVEPVASDGANRRGAKLVVSFVGAPFVDAWHTLVSALLNGELAPSDLVTGLVLSVHPTGSTIQVWLSDAGRVEEAELIACQLKLLLDTPAVHLARHIVAAEVPPYQRQRPLPDAADDEPAAVAPASGVASRLRVEPSMRCCRAAHSSRRKPAEPENAEHFDACALDACAIVSKPAVRCRRSTPSEHADGASPALPAELVRAHDVARTDAALDSSSSDDEVDLCLKRIGVVPSKQGRPRPAKTPPAHASAAADFAATLLLVAATLVARLCTPCMLFGGKTAHCPPVSTMYYDTYCRNAPKHADKPVYRAPFPLRSRKSDRRSARALFDALMLPAAATVFGVAGLVGTLCLQSTW